MKQATITRFCYERASDRIRGPRACAGVGFGCEPKLLDRLYCAPGNGGIADVAECVALEVTDYAGT